MKSIAGLLLTIVVGAGAGVALAHWRIRLAAWDGPPTAVGQGNGATGPLAQRPAPKLSIDSTEYDFGTLSLEAKGERAFVVRNRGDAPLRLSAGETSCKCTLSQIERSEVPPNQETRILLTWRGEESPGPYRQTATILTNDPARPRVVLTVSGEMVAAVRSVPGELVLSQVSADEETIGRVRLYGYLDEPVRVVDWGLEDEATAEKFAVGVEPLPQEEIDKEPRARSGLLIVVRVKPGLPQGAFQQTIRLQTNYEAAPLLEIPVKGAVSSDLSVFGLGWDADRGVCNLGTINRAEGAQRRLLLVARGPGREEVSFRPVEVVPDQVKVTLGERTAVNKGAAYHTPLLISIPKDSRTGSYLGPSSEHFGRIELETTHPRVRKLRIWICFAIED